jgi:hypothetical protein
MFTKSKTSLIFVQSIQIQNSNCLSCGSYNPVFYVCCNGVINNLVGELYSTGCCGTKSYHTSFYKCINGVISN